MDLRLINNQVVQLLLSLPNAYVNELAHINAWWNIIHTNWARMCNSGPVHNTLEKFKSPALFLQEGLFSALIQHENEAFQIEELQNAGFAF